MKEKTIAIIGAGISGLSAGAALAKRGYKVNIFEANSFIGGCCSTVTMDGYTFNNGAMAVILPSMLEYVFRKLGVERASVLPLKKIAAPQASIIGDEVVTIKEGGTILFEKDKRAEAEAQSDVANLLGRWGDVYQILQEELFLNSFSGGRLAARIMKHIPQFGGTVPRELGRLINNKNLRAALLGLLSYAGEPPEKLPTATVLAIISALKDGYYLPEKGMGQIADALAGVLRSHGGEIIVNARVKRIYVQGKRGLEFENGEFFAADTIISSVSGMLTFGKLLAEEDVPASMKRKARDAKLSMKGFAVQIGTRELVRTENFLSYILPPLDLMNDYFTPQDRRFKYGLFAVPTVHMPELAPAGTSSLEIGLSIGGNLPLSAWTDAETERVSNEALEMVRRYHDFDVVVKRVRSPRQFHDELNLYEGAIYGVSPLAGIFGLFPYKTRIPGLYLTGQTTFPGFGITPSAVSGILLAERYF
jgi:phytoene dehydrogenase-like protein